jgi:hypothetical protein
LLLKDLFGFRGKYLSGNLNQTLDFYIDCFFLQFLKRFDYVLPKVLVPESPAEEALLKLFLGFCKLRFPKTKVTLLLEMFNDESSLEVSQVSNEVNNSRKISIKKSRELLKANRAFKLICKNYLKFS